MTSAAGGTGPVAEFTGRTGVVLERLNRLYPSLIDLSLGRLEALLARLGNPEEKLPPVVHVAGTNGKGSTCATLRALGEASGWRVHVTSSPHLIDVRERFRVAGTLVSENDLIAILEEIERVNDGAPITVFEVLTAAAFLLFSRTPADLAVIEVGLGGRFDATNVLRHPAVCAITPVSLDHEAFLGNTIEAIAAEKAGIMKPGVPVVCAPQDPRSIPVFEAEAARLGAPLWLHGRDWSAVRSGDAVLYRDVHGELKLPLPALPGDHQILNAGLAVAALRAAGMPVPEQGWQGVGRTVWPARLQKLEGDLAQTLPTGWELWLDGGHNPGAGEVLSSQLKTWSDRPLHVIVGMKQTKDAAGFIRPLLPYVTSIYAVQEAQQHMALPVAQILAAGGEKVQPGPTIAAALDKIRQQNDGPARVLICGSLYLAGVVLKRDGWVVV